jgi:hypothetical protein
MRKTKSENERNVGVFRYDRGASYDPITKRSANKMVAERLADWIPGRCAIAMARPGEPLPKVPVRASRKKMPTVQSQAVTSKEVDKKEKPSLHPRGLSANPTPNCIERYASAVDSGTDRRVIVMVDAWSPTGLPVGYGLYE